MFPTKHRKVLMLSLVSAFLVQTYLVYSDKTGLKTGSLSASAHHGRKIWLKNNCQSCHQIFGFGGFLGPDLTNTAHEFDAEELQEVLATGPGQMPSIKISKEEAQHLKAYFKELNKTGQSQAFADKDSKGLAIFELKKLPWFEFERI